MRCPITATRGSPHPVLGSGGGCALTGGAGAGEYHLKRRCGAIVTPGTPTDV